MTEGKYTVNDTKNTISNTAISHLTTENEVVLKNHRENCPPTLIISIVMTTVRQTT